MTNIHLALTVNGEPTEVAFAPYKTLLEVLREDLNLCGTKHGCELGECGACAVLLDGQPVLSCLVLGVECDGRDVLTVEGLVTDGRLHPLQEAFADLGAAQCGYCTPGFLVTAKALLDEHANPTRDQIREALAGCLCRCTGYQQIFEAVEAAIATRPATDLVGAATRRCTAERTGAEERDEHHRQAAAPRRRPRQGHRPDALRRRRDAAAHAALQAAALDRAARAHRADRRLARAGASRRPPRPHRRGLPHLLRHPAGQPGRACARASIASASSAIRSPRSSRATS